MTETKTTRARRDDDHPDTTGSVPSLSTTDVPPDTEQDPSSDQPTGPAPARSYAGSGTTEPVELNPATHGTHYRGSTGDV